MTHEPKNPPPVPPRASALELPAVETYPGLVEPASPDGDIAGIMPPPSTIWVEGRREVFGWTNAQRAALGRLKRDASFLGLQVHEVDLALENPNKKWSFVRVDLDYAAATIADFPGITLDDWAADLWGRNMEQPLALPAVRRARAKAQVALHRLNYDGRVSKRHHPKTGKMLLWPAGSAPDQRAISVDFVPPVPPTLVEARAKGLIA